MKREEKIEQNKRKHGAQMKWMFPQNTEQIFDNILV